MTSINKSLLAHSFNRAADSYPNHSKLQQGISRRLLSFLIGRQRQDPRRILDLGCGAGFSTRLLADHLPEAEITALDLAAKMIFFAREQLCNFSNVQFVCADMENMPFASGCFDLVFSSSVIQWSDNRQRLAAELCRILKPQGLACLSSFCQNTLSELRASWRRADSWEHTIDFASHRELCRQINSCGMTIHLAHRQTEIVPYGSVLEFLHDMKKAGIKNCRRDRRCSGLTTPRRFRRMQENYQACYALGQGVRARYEVVFIIAGKA